MAKIIQKGWQRIVHNSCGSLIEFSATDLQEDYDVDYLGGREEYKYLICPACNNKIKLSKFFTFNRGRLPEW